MTKQGCAESAPSYECNYWYYRRRNDGP